MFEFIAVAGVAAFVLFLAAMFVFLIAKRLLYICGPNEVLIFSGSVRAAEGRNVGYRTIKGGRAWRVPLLEEVDRIDLTNMIIEVSVTNAYSKGGIPLSIQGVANVKVAGHEPVLNNAVERFLHYDRKMIVQVVKDTLEGNLRGVLSQLTPEQVNEDKIMFAEKLLEEAEHDLTRLGLTLDTLKIQNVSDDKGYLNSIGRKQSAELIKRSRVAEANAKANSAVKDATNREAARIREFESQGEIVRAETERRVVETLTRREALVAEEVGGVQAAIAKAEGELRVYQARVEQTRRQLEADVVAPAQADMEASISNAKGDAAKILENGKATVAVLEEMIAAWHAGGTSARDIFLVQKLHSTMAALSGTIKDVRIDKLTVLPSDAQAGARTAITLSEEVKGALGVDLPQLVAGMVNKR